MFSHHHAHSWIARLWVVFQREIRELRSVRKLPPGTEQQLIVLSTPMSGERVNEAINKLCRGRGRSVVFGGLASGKLLKAPVHVATAYATAYATACATVCATACAFTCVPLHVLLRELCEDVRTDSRTLDSLQASATTPRSSMRRARTLAS